VNTVAGAFMTVTVPDNSAVPCCPSFDVAMGHTDKAPPNNDRPGIDLVGSGDKWKAIIAVEFALIRGIVDGLWKIHIESPCK